MEQKTDFGFMMLQSKVSDGDKQALKEKERLLNESNKYGISFSEMYEVERRVVIELKERRIERAVEEMLKQIDFEEGNTHDK